MRESVGAALSRDGADSVPATMRFPRRSPSSLVVLVALATAGGLLLAACSDDGGSSSRRPTGSTGSTTPGSTTSGDGGGPQLGAVNVKLTPIAQVDDPTALATRQGDNALYVTEQVGRVRAVRDDQLAPEPVLDITSDVQSGGEQGLLGLAFSPDGTRMYVHYTNRSGDTRLDEYTMSGATPDPATRRQVLEAPGLQPNHNGGEVDFGPDGMLYIGLGDGGGAGDSGSGHAPGGNGQSLDTLLGKILRIDPTPAGGRPYTIPPDNPFANGGGRPEIWAYGLRNPWRFTWDRETDDLWIADVGQNAWEEIDFVAGGRGAGMNFGWNPLEGTHEFAGDPPPNAVPPIFEYPLDGGACAAIGGYVYRGSKIPALRGAYLYSDYCDSGIRALVEQDGRVTDQRDLGPRGNQVTSFGENPDGELYVLSQGDGLQRVDPA
jgi:glucose/arabinose dehydrogenase